MSQCTECSNTGENGSGETNSVSKGDRYTSKFLLHVLQNLIGIRFKLNPLAFLSLKNSYPSSLR